MYEINEQQIRQWWQVFKGDGKLVEIRLLGMNTYSGYFTDVERLISQLRPMLDYNNFQYYGSMQAYFTLNDINPELYSREQRDVFKKRPKATTTDGDIIRRRFILIDLDPNRAAGISASDAEFEKAHLKAVDVYRYLVKAGFHEPIITRSGNGWHVYLTCDMPNDEQHNELVKRFLQSLSKMFSDDAVSIDEKVFNPARIDKLIGTWAKKGSDSEERRWRIADIVKVPSVIEPNDDSLFQAIADLLPKEEPKPLPNRQRSFGNAPFDVVSWLNEHGIKYKEEKQGANTRYTLEYCPWVDTHSDRKKWDSALFQDANGKLTFNCQHSHCKDKTWHDVRLFYEPDAYDRPAQPQQYVPRQYAVQKPKYVIKDESPELGGKWLSLSDIKKVDLSQIETMKTGFAELDRAIVGLNMAEVTLLSGSNSSGKSSWLNTLILNVINQGTKVALWSGELPDYILKTWIQMVAAGKRNLRLSQFKEGKYYVPDNIATHIDQWLDGKFFLYNNEYGNTWEQIFHDMNELLKLGVKLFVLDNLFSLNIDLLEGDRNNKQKELILQIKEFAKKNKVHIILVAHPRKAMTFLRKNDISGTSDLTNAVDDVFIIHRVNNDFLRTGEEFFGKGSMSRFESYGNVVEVAKNRMYGVVDLMVGLHYEIESRRFKNSIDEDLRYGWEAEPQQQSFEYNEPAPQESDDGLPFAAFTDSNAPF